MRHECAFYQSKTQTIAVWTGDGKPIGVSSPVQNGDKNLPWDRDFTAPAANFSLAGMRKLDPVGVRIDPPQISPAPETASPSSEEAAAAQPAPAASSEAAPPPAV